MYLGPYFGWGGVNFGASASSELCEFISSFACQPVPNHAEVESPAALELPGPKKKVFLVDPE